jgi:hypothetical protein
MNWFIIVLVVIIAVLAMTGQVAQVRVTKKMLPPQSCGRQLDGPCPVGTKCVAGFCTVTDEPNLPPVDPVKPNGSDLVFDPYGEAPSFCPEGQC